MASIEYYGADFHSNQQKLDGCFQKLGAHVLSHSLPIIHFETLSLSHELDHGHEHEHTQTLHVTEDFSFHQFMTYPLSLDV